MKKVIFLILSLMFCLYSFGQSKKSVEMLSSIEGQYSIDENNGISYVKIIDSIPLTKDEIYNRAYGYFVYKYNSGESVIQMQDKINGVLMGKGLYAKVHTDVSLLYRNIDTWHILRIDIKENKVRIILTLTEYRYTVSDGKGLPNIDNWSIATTYPFNEKGPFKTFMSKAFFKSHEKAMETLSELEKAIKEGNTSKVIENNNW